MVAVEGLDVPLGHIEVAFPLEEGPCGGQPAPEGAFPRGQSAALFRAGSGHRVTSQLGQESVLPGVQVIGAGPLGLEPLPRVRRPGFVRPCARGVVGPLPGDRPGRVPSRVQGGEGICPFCGEATGAGALGRRPAPEGIVSPGLVVPEHRDDRPAVPDRLAVLATAPPSPICAGGWSSPTSSSSG